MEKAVEEKSENYEFKKTFLPGENSPFGAKLPFFKQIEESSQKM